MSFPDRKLAKFRLWILLVLLGLTLTTGCGSSDESSCQPEDEDYPECLDSGATG